MNEVATRPQQQQQQQRRGPLDGFKKDLSEMKQSGDLDMLPSNVSYESFRNAALVAVTDNPTILQCNKASIFKAVRRLAAAGLVPDGREAALVPYKGEAQAMPMVFGLIKTARNSGEVQSLWADVVYEGEELKVWIEDGQRKFDHVYDPLTRSGEIRGAFAVAKMKDGAIEFEPMSLENIEKRRKASATQKSDKPSGIWEKWYDEMAKKTVIRALCKRLPLSAEDHRRMMIEQEAPMRDVTPQEDEGPKGFAGLAARARSPQPEMDEPAPEAPDAEESAPAAETEALQEEIPREDAAPDADEPSGPYLGDAPDASGEAPAPDWYALRNTIIEDMHQGGVDATLNFYADQLAEMKKHAVMAHSDVQKEGNRLRAEEEAAG